jgi:hypothetical protein
MVCPINDGWLLLGKAETNTNGLHEILFDGVVLGAENLDRHGHVRDVSLACVVKKTPEGLLRCPAVLFDPLGHQDRMAGNGVETGLAGETAEIGQAVGNVLKLNLPWIDCPVYALDELAGPRPDTVPFLSYRFQCGLHVV